MCFDGLIVTVSVAQVGGRMVELWRWMARVTRSDGWSEECTVYWRSEGFLNCELSVESVRCSYTNETTEIIQKPGGTCIRYMHMYYAYAHVHRCISTWKAGDRLQQLTIQVWGGPQLCWLRPSSDISIASSKHGWTHYGTLRSSLLTLLHSCIHIYTYIIDCSPANHQYCLPTNILQPTLVVQPFMNHIMCSDIQKPSYYRYDHWLLYSEYRVLAESNPGNSWIFWCSMMFNTLTCCYMLLLYHLQQHYGL